MTAEQLYHALTGSGKPVTAARLLKAQKKANSPVEYAALVQRLTEEGKLPQ